MTPQSRTEEINKIIDFLDDHNILMKDYQWDLFSLEVSKALEAYAAEKVKQVIDGYNETKLIKDARAEARNEALEKAAVLCDENTKPSKEICNSDYHDFRWCYDCDRMTAMADVLGQEIRALKSPQGKTEER